MFDQYYYLPVVNLYVDRNHTQIELIVNLRGLDDAEMNANLSHAATSARRGSFR